MNKKTTVNPLLLHFLIKGVKMFNIGNVIKIICFVNYSHLTLNVEYAKQWGTEMLVTACSSITLTTFTINWR